MIKLKCVHKSIMGEMHFSGEGINGDYNPMDPEDFQLLRVEIFEQTNDGRVPIEGASCCTQLSTCDKRSDIESFLKKLVDEVSKLIVSGSDGEVKKLVESASFQPQKFIK